MSELKIKLMKESTHWKDRMAGWAKYRVSFICEECGKPFSETIHGEYHEVRSVYVGNQVCDDCGSVKE